MRCSKRLSLSLPLSGLLLLFFSPTSVADSLDWPSWRGPLQNGISLESGIVDRLDLAPSPDGTLRWKSEAAAGISTPIVMNGRLYTIARDQPGTPSDREKIVCLDAATGELLWENAYNVFLSDVPAERVGWSHCAGDPERGRVYALGACSLLNCVDAATGETVWTRSLAEEFGMLSTYGGRTNTPVLFEDLVIVSGVTTGWDETARPAHRFFAFDKHSGTLIWQTSTRPLPEDTTYSTPVIRTVDGVPTMFVGSGDGGLYAIEPRTGRILWREDLSRRGVNVSPIVSDEGIVYAGHSEENPSGTVMGSVVAFAGGSGNADERTVWRQEGLMVGKSSPLLVGNRLYVVEDSSALHVLDAFTGEPIGRRVKLGTAMRGSLLWADGKLYAATATGICYILRPTEDGVETVFKTRLPRGHEVGGSPIVSHGRLYIPTTGGLFCFADPAAEGKGGLAATAPLERERDVNDTHVAHVQIVPAEALLQPGQKLSLEIRLFNQFGQRLDSAAGEPSFSVSGQGQVDPSGVFRSDATNHSAVTVNATVGMVTGTARIRVIPALPWRFSFDDAVVPITWIGARYRHEPVQLDSGAAMVKISTIPKGTRSQSWFGPTELNNYTVQADFLARGETGDLPDMGLIGQRYTLDLMGKQQQLQIRTWAAQLRMAQSVPVEWQADLWYTLKFRVATTDSGGVQLEGKVWPREQTEPETWSITATDPSPNLAGSPGLFGNSTAGEFLIDNVSVVANE